MNAEIDSDTPLQKASSHCEKFYFEVHEQSKTFDLLAPLFRKKTAINILPFTAVMCDDGKLRRLLKTGWTLADQVDRIARLAPEFKGKLNFAIWTRIEKQKSQTLAELVRRHGSFRPARQDDTPKMSEAEFETSMRAKGVLL